MNRIRSFFSSVFSRRRRTREQPYKLTPVQVREGFDQIRASIPVDDDELRRARPVSQLAYLRTR